MVIFLDWRHRDLFFWYHSDGTGHFLFFVEKSDTKGQQLNTLPIWNRWNWTHFVFCWKIGHNISTIGHISNMKPMGVSQSDMDTNMKSNISDMKSPISIHNTIYESILVFLVCSVILPREVGNPTWRVTTSLSRLLGKKGQTQGDWLSLDRRLLQPLPFAISKSFISILLTEPWKQSLKKVSWTI
jgi:hypothetical protein